MPRRVLPFIIAYATFFRRRSRQRQIPDTVFFVSGNSPPTSTRSGLGRRILPGWRKSPCVRHVAQPRLAPSPSCYSSSRSRPGTESRHICRILRHPICVSSVNGFALPGSSLWSYAKSEPPQGAVYYIAVLDSASAPRTFLAVPQNGSQLCREPAILMHLGPWSDRPIYGRLDGGQFRLH